MTLHVLTPGLATSVQDAGRRGLTACGVGTGGAADRYSLHVANLLVGNPPGAAALEITLAGPRLRCTRALRIALAGADVDADADGIALPGWRTIDVPAGCELRIGGCRRGARAYLAVGGGIGVPAVLGSRATDLRGGFGGHEGRWLRAGDEVPVGAFPAPEIASPRIAGWWVNPAPDLAFGPETVLHVLRGDAALDRPGALFADAWRVANNSDRQGVRLQGAALQAADAGERISEPVLPGTIQLPPDGTPIVLLADAQTVGGYPRIGHVRTCDLPRAAQLRAGDRVRFVACDLDTAEHAARAQRQRLARMAIAIEARAAQFGRG